MSRPKGSKNKPKTGTIKPSPALKKAVAKGKVKLAPVVAKAVVESKPLPVETPTKAKTQAAAGKNVGEAVIVPVDDNAGEDTGSHVVIQGGKAVMRKNSSNPDLD